MQYYTLLDLKPGANPEQIKNAFRTKIKECHPDTNASDGEKARNLIEAYRGLLKGETGPRVNGEPAYASAHNHPDYNPYRTGERPNPRGVRGKSYAEGLHLGRKIYESTFGKASAGVAPSIENFWESIHRMVVEEGEDAPAFERNAHVRQAPTNDPLEGIPGGKSRDAFERAEGVLKEIVAKYNKQTKRPRSSWSRDYIRDLTQIQVLYRDAMRRHTSLTSRSLSRLQQIHELIHEIKKIARP